jgi:hypothetical protein
MSNARASFNTLGTSDFKVGALIFNPPKHFAINGGSGYSFSPSKGIVSAGSIIVLLRELPLGIPSNILVPLMSWHDDLL